MHTRPQVWGHPIAVDWAEPEVEVDEDVMATVKILYVRNLMLNTTEEQLEKVCKLQKLLCLILMMVLNFCKIFTKKMTGKSFLN